MFSLYVLCEPSGEIRYVGVTRNLEWRLYSHVAYASQHQHHCATWIKSLLRQGKKPKCFVLQEFDTQEEAFAAGQPAIAKFRREGYRLTNFCDGGGHSVLGKTWQLSEAQRQNIAQGRKRYFAQLREAGMPIQSPRAGATLSSETKAKIAAARRGSKGTPHTPEFKRALAERNRARVWSDESRAKASASAKEARKKGGS